MFHRMATCYFLRPILCLKENTNNDFVLDCMVVLSVLKQYLNEVFFLLFSFLKIVCLDFFFLPFGWFSLNFTTTAVTFFPLSGLDGVFIFSSVLFFCLMLRFVIQTVNFFLYSRNLFL